MILPSKANAASSAIFRLKMFSHLESRVSTHFISVDALSIM